MKKTILAALCACLLLTPVAWAGDCLETPEEYVEVFRKMAASPSQAAKARIIESLWCLMDWVSYLEMGYEYFASPTAIASIAKKNQGTKALVYKYVPQLLKHQDEFVRCRAAYTLAYYRWPGSYEYLMRCDNDPKAEEVKYYSTTKAILLAILGDRRATPWIIRQYRIVDQKYRSRPIFSYREKMTYLNALYHLADPAALPFIEEVIKNPRPSKIAKRAKKVKARIEAQQKR